MQRDSDTDRESLTTPIRFTEPKQQKFPTNMNATQDDEGNTLIGDLHEEKRKKLIKWGLIGGAILIIVILAIVLPIALSKKEKPVPPGPEPDIKPPVLPNSTNNYFFKPDSIVKSTFGYSGQIFFSAPIQSLLQEEQSLFTSSANFTPKIGVDWNSTIKFGPNNQRAEVLNFTFDMIDFKVARLVLTDGKNQRFSVPEEAVNKPEGNQNMRLDMVGFHFDQSDAKSPFSFSFRDVADNNIKLIDTAGQNLIFSDKYIQMDFVLPSRRQYGFGERMHGFQLGEGAWGMWANGQNGLEEPDTGRGRGGEYGVHPFLLVQTRKPQQYVGMFFRNANAQTPIIRFNDDNQTTTMSYITLGGQIEVYFIIHGSAKQVIQEYHKLIGKPQLPPFWSLGWQEASFLGNDEGAIDKQINSYNSSMLPLETVYLEKDFYNETKNFALYNNALNATQLRQKLTALNMRLVGFLDSAIYLPSHVTLADTENFYYVEGDLLNLFIKTTQYAKTEATKYNNNLVGKRGDQQCVYIDWFNYEKVPSFWFTALYEYQQNVHFDGLWTTDNEPLSSQQGEVDVSGVKARTALKADNQSYYDKHWYSAVDSQTASTYYLPFTPQFEQEGPFDMSSISLNASHANYTVVDHTTGQRVQTKATEYDLHSLYGHSMMQATHQQLSKVPGLADQRLFLLTRSTYASTGRYASYAVRSKYRSWTSLSYSIPHLMNMNMFGIPHSGADMCGYYEIDPTATNMDEELCLRWVQLATFMPLARHSQDFSIEQNYLTSPVGITDPAKKEAVKASMHDRLQYLRLMYTCLFEASEFGGTCIDPLFFHHTIDVLSYHDEAGTNDTFIFGGAVKVSPVVNPQLQNQTYKSHFPIGRWVNLADMSEVIEATVDGPQLLKYRPTVNAHLRPGSLIPFQSNSDMQARTTVDMLKKPISLIINRNSHYTSKGTVFLDGGISRQELSQKTYEYYTIEHKASKSIQFQLTQGTIGAQDAQHTLDSIMIADASDIQDTDFACAFLNDGSIQELTRNYNTTQNTLTFAIEKFSPALKFSKINNIAYGSSSKKDLNLCHQASYEYMIPAEFNLSAVLSSNEGTIPLIHKAGVLPNLTLTLRIFDEGIVNVKWTWQGTSKRAHFEVPNDIVNTSRSSKQGDAIGRRVQIQRNPFQLNFTQQAGQTQPFLQIKNLIYDSYLNWVGMQAFTLKDDQFRGIMGLGERSQKDLFYKDGIYSMWATDEPTKVDDGKLPGKQAYGVHPFFMYQHTANHWVGVFFKQSNAQDWHITNKADEGIVQVKQIATGGVTDIYVMFNAQRPDSVVGFYQNIVGKPVLLPQWAFGWHQCKYCYRSQDDYRSVVDNYRANNIPLDAQWADIDYMDRYRDFSLDPINFGNLTKYVDDLYHNMNIKFVPIIDAGIAMRPGQNYSAYDIGMEKGLFLKMKDSEDPFVGRVWPNEAVFPDFFHPETASWWENQLTQFQQNLIWFDGVWLDMNEAANFCNGPCQERQIAKSSQLDYLHYNPTGRDLQYKSLPVDIEHYNKITQLDAHSYYGSQQTKATHDWFVKKGEKRPFIIERSSFAGMGKYGSKWLGDSSSTYEDMQRSVTGSMMMNMFGIPYVGGDICGFGGNDTTPELCARWHQVGAFQPFSRNHRDCEGKPQEPYRFINITVGNLTVTDIMRSAIQAKYSLMPYYYTQMFLLSKDVQSVGTFYKPMFFEFPNENGAYSANPSENVMLGSSLKLSVKTTQNTNWTDDLNEYFFPKGNWCDVLHPETLCVFATESQITQLPSGLKDFQVHLREGHIIPMQNATTIMPNTTDDMRDFPIDLHIHPRNTTQTNRTVIFQASGQYVNDNGASTNIENNHNHYQVFFNYRDVVNNQSNDEQIIITIAVKASATNYYSNETKCSNVTQADFLGSIYIFDEFGLFQHSKYFVELLRPDGTFDELGLAEFDQYTNRMVYDYNNAILHNDAAFSVCLGFVQEIIFRPSIM